MDWIPSIIGRVGGEVMDGVAYVFGRLSEQLGVFEASLVLVVLVPAVIAVLLVGKD